MKYWYVNELINLLSKSQHILLPEAGVDEDTDHNLWTYIGQSDVGSPADQQYYMPVADRLFLKEYLLVGREAMLVDENQKVHDQENNCEL